MAIVNSFGYVANTEAKVLILGSMPGKVSLAKQQYYGHAQNLFWPFMNEILGIDPTLAYEQKLALLQNNGIALWDVMQECERHSSLDSDILEHSIKPNDFNDFFLRYPAIRHIFFNGTKAELSFRKYVLPANNHLEYLQLIKLPSTSPANASISRMKKLEEWRKVISFT
ncbi:MAG: DNA-deoxyinosine glycosylase [Methylophilaceae bacterium]|nr:DNA-deoxyinosine glycosylase [Methyloradius sp.]